ncbi:MAG: hypothetical protein H0V66_11030 [Bdellovibrionales bacterium]|nr:hypothetical protein [Bdellovibrionales bacterium]
MKILFMILMLATSLNTFATDEKDKAATEVVPEDASTVQEISPEKAKEMLEALRKGQKNREDQTKFIEELE